MTYESIQPPQSNTEADLERLSYSAYVLGLDEDFFIVDFLAIELLARKSHDTWLTMCECGMRVISPHCYIVTDDV